MPVKAGPAKPPRFPIAAISAIPAAAAEPVRNAVGKAQKTGIADSSPTADRVIATVSRTGRDTRPGRSGTGTG
jgi:hypothetical protein